MRYRFYPIYTMCLFFVLFFSTGPLCAGNSRMLYSRDTLMSGLNRLSPASQAADSLSSGAVPAVADTAFVVTDSLAVADSLGMPVKPRPEGSLDIPVFSAARDSTIDDFSGGKRMTYYYGDVSVTYGNMKLTAEYMAYDMDTKTVFASGIKDSTGKWIGKPVMEDNGATYEMENVYYNFNSMKAKVKNVVTQEKDGILYGSKIKMMPDKSINISKGRYTVCDCEHPHYYLNMTAAKVVSQPSQRTVFGPAYLVLGDVPLYPLFIPYGFVPKRPDRASGILFPTYGEEAARGFYLRNGGVYLTLGDYFDVALTTDIYTLGSWAIKLNSRYKLRYKFDGGFDFIYSHDQFGERGGADFSESSNFKIGWRHAMDPKAVPGTRFTASVNFSSPANNKYNYQNIDQALESQASSSISYSKTWSNMSLSINALHNQNNRDSSYSFTLPNITFSVNRFYPFKRKVRVGKEKLYEKISLAYTTTLQNKISFKAKEIKEPDFFNKFKTGMSHKFTIGLPQFTLLKYLNFSPSVNYGMNMYFQTQEKYYNPETNKVETETSKPFEHFGISQDFSAGISMSTRIYGMYTFKGDTKVQAIRHMITPSISFNYKPELGVPINGYVFDQYYDVNGELKSLEYNKYAGGINSPPSRGQTAGLSFSIGNNIEAKVLDKKDTTGTGTKKIPILDQLQLRGSYNFLADSLRLSTLSVNASTNILQKLSLQGNITLDPYAVNNQGQRINTFNIVQKGGLNLVRLTNASASLSFRIDGKGKMKGNDGSSSSDANTKASEESMYPYNKIYYHPYTGEYIPGGWLYYMNPEVPWSLDFSYNYQFTRSYKSANGKLEVENRHVQTLSVSGGIRLTKALNLTFRTGFDFTSLALTATSISATYDLHCFLISVNWTPIGPYQSWNFTIAAKAAALADLLKFEKNKSQWDY